MSYLLESAIAATLDHDADRLRSMLTRAAVTTSSRQLIIEVLVPLMERIGQLWERGEMTPGQEHIASVVVHDTLTGIMNSARPVDEAPLIVAATLEHQHHEIGLLLASATAVLQGWRVLYLGRDLPAEEIAGTVTSSGAGVLALSIVHPFEESELIEALETLRKQLPPEVAIVAGGQGSRTLRDTLEGIGAEVIGDLDQLAARLDRLAVAQQQSPS
jgi:methanogenic corrinoid protein MtbC1